MFDGCKHLKEVNMSNFDLVHVDDINGLFYGCLNLSNVIGIESWNISNVKNMIDTFYLTKLQQIDLSKWNVSNVNEKNV